MVARSDAEKASDLEGNHIWNVNKRDIGYHRSCVRNTGRISSLYLFDNHLVAQHEIPSKIKRKSLNKFGHSRIGSRLSGET